MRRAGRVVAEMHDVCREAIRPGVTTAQLDALARDVLTAGPLSETFGLPLAVERVGERYFARAA